MAMFAYPHERAEAVQLSDFRQDVAADALDLSGGGDDDDGRGGWWTWPRR